MAKVEKIKNKPILFENLGVENYMYTENLYNLETRFYKLQEFLFEGEFSDLSNNARVMYAILRDRQNLSIENGWKDEKGYIYFVYTNAELSKILKLSEPTIIKCKDTLINKQLLYTKQMGRGLPSRLYVLRPQQKQDEKTEPEKVEDKNNNKIKKQELKKFKFKNLKNLSSRTKKTLVLELKKFKPNYTNNNYTNNIYNNHSFIQDNIYINNKYKFKSEKKNEGRKDINKKNKSLLDNYNNYKSILEKNLDFDILKKYKPKYEIRELSVIIELMLEVMIFGEEKIQIGDNTIFKKILIDRFLKLKYEHIEFVLKQIRKNKFEIKNYKNYVIMCLYNAYTLYDIHLMNEVGKEEF